MASDMPVHAPFTGEPGGAPEYAPAESPPEVAPDAPLESPQGEPFSDDGAPTSPPEIGFDTGAFTPTAPD